MLLHMGHDLSDLGREPLMPELDSREPGRRNKQHVEQPCGPGLALQLVHHGERGLQTRPAERKSASLLFSQVTLRAAQRSSQLFPER